MNRVLPSLHGGSQEKTLTVPLNLFFYLPKTVMIKIEKFHKMLKSGSKQGSRGRTVYCSFWEGSVLQFLGRQCTAVSGKKVYSKTKISTVEK